MPEGYGQYPGGHFLRLDLAGGAFRDYGTSPEAEGLLSLGMDTARRRLYACPWIELPPRHAGDRVGHQVDLTSFADPLAG